MTRWIIYLTNTHPKLSKNVYVYCIIPSSLFTTIFFKWAKTVHLQEPSAPFCGVLNELISGQTGWDGTFCRCHTGGILVGLTLEA